MVRHILMLGPGREVKGGISSVVNVYLNSNLINKYRIVYISTQVDGSKLWKLIQFIISIVFFFYQMSFSRNEIIHIHSASRSSFYRKSFFVLFSKLFRKKVILHIHGAEFKVFYHKESGLLMKWFVRRIMNLSDEIIALSFNWKKDLEKIVSFGKEIKVLPNPVSVPGYKRDYKDSNPIKILFMGRLGERKGVYDLIKVAEGIDLKHNNIKFILCGDGDIEKVRRMVNTMGIDQYFEIPGWTQDKVTFFKKADIYVLPSYNEGMPMSILEAASYGLPIISTPVGGIGEVIEDGVNGFLVNPGDIEALKEKILLLVNSVELRTRMSKEALRIVKEKFEVNKIVEQLNNIHA